MAMEIVSKYNYLVIDSVNLAYKLFQHKSESPTQIGNRQIYKKSVCNFINFVEDLKSKCLLSDGEIFLLFDNYFSKADLKSMFMYSDRKKLDEAYKSNRSKDNKEFYNSLNFLRYYYLIAPSTYHTVRIDNLEADDLVEPVLNYCNVFKDNTKRALLVTSDMDWTRYLNTNVDWLPDLSKSPETLSDMSNRYGFPITKKNVILYKALFGDKSDNIDNIAVLNEQNFNSFLELIKVVSDLDDIIYMSRDEETCEKYPVLKELHKKDKKRKYENREAMYRINIQLISSIPCSLDSLKCHLTSGRNAESLFKTVREAIGLENHHEFVFGNVKRSRLQ